jgi:hypothetical protein
MPIQGGQWKISRIVVRDSWDGPRPIEHGPSKPQACVSFCGKWDSSYVPLCVDPLVRRAQRLAHVLTRIGDKGAGDQQREEWGLFLRLSAKASQRIFVAIETSCFCECEEGPIRPGVPRKLPLTSRERHHQQGRPLDFEGSLSGLDERSCQEAEIKCKM